MVVSSDMAGEDGGDRAAGELAAGELAAIRQQMAEMQKVGTGFKTGFRLSHVHLCDTCRSWTGWSR